MVSWARSVVLNAGDRGGRCYPPVVLKWGDFVFKRTFGNVSGHFFYYHDLGDGGATGI